MGSKNTIYYGLSEQLCASWERKCFILKFELLYNIWLKHCYVFIMFESIKPNLLSSIAFPVGDLLYKKILSICFNLINWFVSATLQLVLLKNWKGSTSWTLQTNQNHEWSNLAILYTAQQPLKKYLISYLSEFTVTTELNDDTNSSLYINELMEQDWGIEYLLTLRNWQF